jgi:hypothetical protein
LNLSILKNLCLIISIPLYQVGYVCGLAEQYQCRLI